MVFEIAKNGGGPKAGAKTPATIRSAVACEADGLEDGWGTAVQPTSSMTSAAAGRRRWHIRVPSVVVHQECRILGLSRNGPGHDSRTIGAAHSADAKKETGNYPMPDEGNAISAKRLSCKQRKDGNLSKDEFDRINRKADKVLSTKADD